MALNPEEWLRQSDYDFDSAEFMHEGGRHFYAAFMSHLAVEKALKGLFIKRTGDFPPRTHNLLFFVNTLELAPPEVVGTFLVKLNEVNVSTRYPEELEVVQKTYTKDSVAVLIRRTREALAWIKQQY